MEGHSGRGDTRGELDEVRREALEFAQIGLYRFRFDGRIVFMDSGALRIFELSDRFANGEGIPGCRIDEIIEYVTPKGQMRREILKEGRLHNREWCFRSLKGNLKWVIEDSYLVDDPETDEKAIQVIVRDITEQRHAQTALHESEEKYRTLVETFPFALSIIQDSKVLFANQATLHMFGLTSLDELIGRDSLQVISPAERERLRVYAQRRIDGDTNVPQHYETVMQREDGHEFPAEVFVNQIVFGGRPALQTMAIDITDRYRAQAALRAGEERYRNIVESIQEGYYEVDLGGSFIFFNKAMCEILGYSAEEMKGLNYRAYYHDDAAIRRAYKTYRQVYQTGQAVQVIDWRVRRKDGGEAILEVSISLMKDAEGAPAGFRGIVRNLTERREVERRVQEAEARYRELFENANDILYTHDLSGRITSVNKMGEQVSGYTREELIGKNILELVAPEHRASTTEMLNRKIGNKEITTRYESVFVSKRGDRVPIEVSTRLIMENETPTGIQGSARDITERVRAEEERQHLQAQILHTQKLESLGVLAGGIAHDFNNLLVGILGNAGLALSRLPDNSPARGYVERIENTAQRAAGLTNQMLAYAGKGAFVVRPLDISQLAREMGQLLTASISKSVRLTYECPAGLPLIRGDVAQLHQVIINLVTNAAEAIGEGNGAVAIRTYAKELDRSQLSALYVQDELEPGVYACIEVRDTGSGMNSETLSRIFDPFFSTKFAGRGLGLAAVLGIVRGHRGAISVESQPAQGTTFRIYFPADPSATAAPESKPAAQTAFDAPQGKGYVLVVDDEPQVLEVAREVLLRCGFDVLCAENGISGVHVFAEYAPEIVLVLLDLTMPGLDGWQTIDQIRQIRTDVPIILSSGYGEQVAVDDSSPNRPDAFIQKPYLPADLAGMVRKVLSTARS